MPCQDVYTGRCEHACATCMDSVRSAASLRGPSSVEQYDLHFTRLEMVAVQSVKAAAMGGAVGRAAGSGRQKAAAVAESSGCRSQCSRSRAASG